MVSKCCSQEHCSEQSGLPPKQKKPLEDNIWKACQEGLLDSVKKIVADDPEMANRPGSMDQVPPLHWAALNGHVEICRCLIDSGAAVNQLGGDQWSTALHWAACRGQLGVMALLIRQGADHASLRDQQGYLPIHIAAQHGQTFAILYLLAIAPAENLEAVDLHGRTPLIWASYRGHDEAVQVLLREGAAATAKDKSGSTALHWASIKGHPQIIKALLASGADPHEADGDGKTAIDYGREKKWPWMDSVLLESGFSIKKPTLEQMESGICLTDVTASKKPRWLPERLYRPLLDQQSIRWVFGRGLPPLLSVVCFYLVSYSFNIVFGFLLSMGILGLARLAFAVTVPNTIQHDPSVPVLNTIHYTFNMIAILINLFTFIPSKTSSLFVEMGILAGGVATCWLLYLSQSGDPGRIGKPKSEEHLKALICELSEKDQFNRRTFCMTCRAGKPVRSKHCRTCGVCVAKFDHHCPWTNNCIGAGNHRNFMLYLLMCAASGVFYMRAVWNYLHSLLTEPLDYGFFIFNIFAFMHKAYQKSPFVLIFSYFIASGTFGVLLLSALQLYNVARNRTTNEAANYWRLEYLHENSTAAIKDLGILGNVLFFFSGKQDPLWYSVGSTAEDNCVVPEIKMVGRTRYSQLPPKDTFVVEFPKQPENMIEVKENSTAIVPNAAEPNLV